jgi:hypothetical protein
MDLSGPGIDVKLKERKKEVLDFRKLTESQKLWFQFFGKQYNHPKNLQFWVYFENCWSRVPCTQTLHTSSLFEKGENRPTLV